MFRQLQRRDLDFLFLGPSTGVLVTGSLRCIGIAVLVIACCAPSRVLGQESQAVSATGTITQIGRELYSVSVGAQHTVFLVTSDGIVLVDPLGRDTIEWLTKELQERFPKRPVRYVLATHYELPRVEAISALYQTADVVGHRDFNARLAAARRASPDSHRFARQVETEFSDRWTVTLGGATVEMRHVENRRVPDQSIVYFPAERTVFASNAPGVTKAPFSFAGYQPADVFAWLYVMSTLDFDTVVLDDGQRVTRAQIAELAQYLDAMRAEAAVEYERGSVLAEVQSRTILPNFAGNPHYAGRQMQLASIYRTLRVFRVEVNGAGLAAMTPRNTSDYCGGFDACSAGGLLSAGTAGLTFWLNRRLGVTGEVTLGAQSWSSRLDPNFAEEVALRQSRSAVLIHYVPRTTPGRVYSIVGGISSTVGDIKGMDRVEGRLLPAGGRHVIESRSLRNGVTFGAGVTQTVSRRMRLYVPVRVTMFMGNASEHWAGTHDVHVGAGLRIDVFRKVK
jgi:glyoxylase-like metal-dependent hydrolase (beta-lactamase superfamily II)